MIRRIGCTIGCLLLFMVPHAGAQNPDYVLSISDETLAEGSSGDVSFFIDNSAGMPLSGWAWGVCQSDGDTIVDIVSVAIGPDAAALEGGDGPDFFAPAVLPGAGWTLGVVVDITGPGALPPGVSLVHTAEYAGNDLGTATLSYCSTLGSPPVQITLSIEGIPDVNDPIQTDGSITVEPAPPAYVFSAPSGTGSYDLDDGSGPSVIGYVSIADNQSPTQPTQGVSFALAFNGPMFLVAAEPAGPVAQINDGDGPDFFGSNLNPVGGPGFTVGIVWALLGGIDVLFPGPHPNSANAVALTFSLDSATLAGNDLGASFVSQFDDTVGDPPVANTVIVNGNTAGITFESGVIDLVAIEEIPFVRGDCNDDGLVNIADGITLINQLFNGAAPLGECVSACDVNGDTLEDQADVIYLLNYRFLGGSAPPAPFPSCGVAEEFDCIGFQNCP